MILIFLNCDEKFAIFLSHIMLGLVFYFEPFLGFISMSFSVLLADMSGFAGYCLPPFLFMWFLRCVSSVSLTGSYTKKEPFFPY